MASYTTFYPTASYEFYTTATAISWHGGWDQVAQKANVTPTIPSLFLPATGPSPGTQFPVLNLCPFQRGWPVKGSRATNTIAVTHTTGLYRCVSDPLEAQTISGTMDVVFGTLGTALGNVAYRVYVAVLEGQTDTVRGVLATEEDPGSHVWASSLTGADFDAPITFTPVNAMSGDRLLIEIGCIERPAGSVSITREIRFGQVSNEVVQNLLTPGMAVSGANRAPSVIFSNALAIQDIDLDPGDVVVGNIDLFIYQDDGTLKGVIQTIGGGQGSGVGMPDGTLWTPSAGIGIEHYDNSGLLLSTVTNDAENRQPHVVRVATGDTSGTVYIGNPCLTGPCWAEDSSLLTNGYIQKVVAGIIVQAWDPAVEYSGIPSFDFAPDGDTIIYTSLGPTIKSYRLSDSTQLADIVSLPPITVDPYDGTFFRGVRCLSDGTILAASVTYASGTVSSSQITHYDTDGSTLHTYDISGQRDWGTISVTNDELSFWAADTGDGRGLFGPVTMAKFNIASEAVEVTITGAANIMQTGSGGHLCSGGQCVIPTASEPVTGTIIVEKVTVPPSDTTEFDFEAGGGLSPTDFSLAHGDTQIYTEVTPGDGYSVEETPDAGYTTTVEVSNASPNTDIEVAAGETVTVTFTNTSIATGAIQVIKVTVPASDETAFDFVATGGLDPATFTLQGGEEEFYGSVAAGSGYAITETAVEGYQTTIAVSNGSPHTNLVVTEGETTIVTFTNFAVAAGFNTRAVKRRWLRRSPIFSTQNARVRWNMFQLDCQVGTGNTVEPGKDPQVYMRYSDDYGQTWSFIMPMPMGKLGRYGTQLQWWRLGVGRNRVFEVYGSDPVKVALIDGFAKVDPGMDGDA